MSYKPIDELVAAGWPNDLAQFAVLGIGSAIVCAGRTAIEQRDSIMRSAVRLMIEQISPEQASARTSEPIVQRGSRVADRG